MSQPRQYGDLIEDILLASTKAKEFLGDLSLPELRRTKRPPLPSSERWRSSARPPNAFHKRCVTGIQKSPDFPCPESVTS